MSQTLFVAPLQVRGPKEGLVKYMTVNALVKQASVSLRIMDMDMFDYCQQTPESQESSGSGFELVAEFMFLFLFFSFPKILITLQDELISRKSLRLFHFIRKDEKTSEGNVRKIHQGTMLKNF